jgi:hypothetical protein
MGLCPVRHYFMLMDTTSMRVVLAATSFRCIPVAKIVPVAHALCVRCSVLNRQIKERPYLDADLGLRRALRTVFRVDDLKSGCSEASAGNAAFPRRS